MEEPRFSYYHHPVLGILATDGEMSEEGWESITYEQYSAVFDANTALARERARIARCFARDTDEMWGQTQG